MIVLLGCVLGFICILWLLWSIIEWVEKDR